MWRNFYAMRILSNKIGLSREYALRYWQGVDYWEGVHEHPRRKKAYSGAKLKYRLKWSRIRKKNHRRKK